MENSKLSQLCVLENWRGGGSPAAYFVLCRYHDYVAVSKHTYEHISGLDVKMVLLTGLCAAATSKKQVV